MLFDELQTLVYTCLVMDSPVLSGNMQNHINYEGFQGDECILSVSGPSYDMKKWKKTKQIVLTNEYDYAISVNRLGAFGGRSTKSRHWANRSIVKAVEAIAPMYNAEVIVDVELY